MNDYPNIMRHEAALRKSFAVPPYIEVQIKMVTKISGLPHLKPSKPLWTGLRVRSANGVYEVFANRPLEILEANFFTVEKKLLEETIISNATRSTNFHLVATGTIDAEIDESLNFMVYQTTATPIG